MATNPISSNIMIGTLSNISPINVAILDNGKINDRSMQASSVATPINCHHFHTLLQFCREAEDN